MEGAAELVVSESGVGCVWLGLDSVVRGFLRPLKAFLVICFLIFGGDDFLAGFLVLLLALPRNLEVYGS